MAARGRRFLFPFLPGVVRHLEEEDGGRSGPAVASPRLSWFPAQESGFGKEALPPLSYTDTCLLTAGPPVCYARYMSVSDQELLHHLSRMPFVDTAELAMITGEAHVAIHRGLAGLLSSKRHYLTSKGVGEAAGVLGFDTASDYVRAYPVSRKWLALLIRRMDAVASVYRLAASLSPGTDGLRTQVDFHRRGRFDAAITRHDGRSFGVVRQGPALRRRSLYDRLRTIAEYEYRRGPGTVLNQSQGETCI